MNEDFVKWLLDNYWGLALIAMIMCYYLIAGIIRIIYIFINNITSKHKEKEGDNIGR